MRHGAGEPTSRRGAAQCASTIKVDASCDRMRDGHPLLEWDATVMNACDERDDCEYGSHGEYLAMMGHKSACV